MVKINVIKKPQMDQNLNIYQLYIIVIITNIIFSHYHIVVSTVHTGGLAKWGH